jgi:hypothetical protein
MSSDSFNRPGSVEDYRHQAAECRKLAETTTDPRSRMTLFNMARTWERLADFAAEPGDGSDRKERRT